MKNLATCKPSEFLKQTNRVKKAAQKWLAATDIMNIRSEMPTFPEGMSDEERQELIQEQATKNFSRMLDSILEEHPEETLELLALCCFVEPENVDDYKVSDYIKAITELINDKAVLGFFTSLTRLGQRNTPKR